MTSGLWTKSLILFPSHPDFLRREGYQGLLGIGRASFPLISKCCRLLLYPQQIMCDFICDFSSSSLLLRQRSCVVVSI